MTSSSPPTSNFCEFSNLALVFDEVFEHVITISNTNELFHPNSHGTKKKKNGEFLSTNLFRACEFKRILQLMRTTISSNLSPDQNYDNEIERAYQGIIDNVKMANNDIKANISRQSFILKNQMNSPSKNSPHQFKSGKKNESPELKVVQHKKELIDARISTTNSQIQLLEAENIKIITQINQITNSKPLNTEIFPDNNIDIEQKLNQIKILKERNADIEKLLQNQQRNSSIFIQKERQEIDRLVKECDTIQSQVSSLESRIELMSARSTKHSYSPTIPSINTAFLSKKSLQGNVVPPQKKIQKRQRIVFRKPAIRSKVVLPSLQPTFNDVSNNEEVTVNQDIGLMEEIAKNALLSAGDTMTTVATVTNVATASSSSQSAFDNRNEIENDDDDNKPLEMNVNYNRKRRKTIGPSPYDIMESSSFNSSIYPHPIDSLLDSKEEAQAAGIVGDDTCFYECPPNTEPSREIRLAPIPPFIPEEIPLENAQTKVPCIKRNPSLASNLSRTSSSEPQPQKSDLIISPETLNGSRPNSISNNNENNNNNNNKETIKMCTRSPLTDDLLRLPCRMPPVHMQNLMMMSQEDATLNGNDNEMNNENENENGEVPLLLTKMPIMIRNSAEFFSRNNSQKRNMSPFDGYDNDENIDSDTEKSKDETENTENKNDKIDSRDVQINNENNTGYHIKEPKINLNNLPTADRAPRPKPGINQM